MKNNERYELNKELAQMLKGGVIMDVTTPEQAKNAEAAGAAAVMASARRWVSTLTGSIMVAMVRRGAPLGQPQSLGSAGVGSSGWPERMCLRCR